MENVEQATAAPGEKRRTPGSCPNCGSCATWFEWVDVIDPNCKTCREWAVCFKHQVPAMAHCDTCERGEPHSWGVDD